MSSSFVHLHVHSEHSLLDGLSRISELLKKCQEFKMPAMALTDHGAMYGAWKFYNLFKNSGVKPIIGCEVYMAKRSRFDKEGNEDKDPYHLLLLAKNYKGYLNLMKIVSLANVEGFYYKARADMELLEKYHEGLIATTACLGGEISTLIMDEKFAAAKEKITHFADLFGEGNFYLEIQHHPHLKEQDLVNRQMIKFAKDLGLPLLATNDSHYTEEQDAEAQELLLCVQTQKNILDPKRPLSMIGSPDFYFKSPEEMEKDFAEVPDSLKNSIRIAEMCDIKIPSHGFILPYFPLPAGHDADEYLNELCFERLKSRFGQTPSREIVERINYELEVITSKGYSTYFLIVADFVNWAKEQKIAVGPGRGSAAGSIVAYVLRITELDPIEYKLPFERFLNPERPTPPDIDMDFADNRRDEVIAYVTQKYGEEKVAQIITFGTMESRQAIRDTARALGLPYSAGDRIAKMIPPPHQGHPTPISAAIQISDDLKRAYETEAETKRLIDLSMKLEGVTRHSSTHAAGIVIADKELTAYTPLARETRGEKIITQYDMYDLDKNISENAIGLLKMDFLGLRNLTILQEAIRFVREYRKKAIDLTKIPLDEKGVYDMISTGETVGIFQIESPGMKNLAKNLRPSKISDLSAMIALYRPGPMDWIPEFVASKENSQKIKYLHPDLKPILEETYGIAVYQEQCMEIAAKMAGYSLAEADNFRKAIGKKKIDVMKREKEKFIAGCLKQKYTRSLAESIFALIEKFAGYGFNKAHSASYALIAYQTAYMKYHFPIEYMTAILTAENRATSGPLKEEKMGRLIAEVKRMKIQVLPPDVNLSGVEFTIENAAGKSAIRFGLSAIKNLGSASIENIIEARKNGVFADLFDFVRRVDGQKVNKKTLESLIKAGAMDEFGKRAAMLLAVDEIRQKIEQFEKNKDSNQDSLFETAEDAIDDASFTLPSADEFTKQEILAFERHFFGFYLTEHPAYEKLLRASENLFKLAEINLQEHEGRKLKLCGMITLVKRIFTRKDGSEMAFVQIDDLTARHELVVFPKTFAENRDKLYEDNVIIIVGRVENKEDNISIIVEEIKEV